MESIADDFSFLSTAFSYLRLGKVYSSGTPSEVGASTNSWISKVGLSVFTSVMTQCLHAQVSVRQTQFMFCL